MKYAVRSTQYAIILSFLLLLLPTPYFTTTHAQPSTPSYAWPDEWLADSAFFNVWSRPDAPVAMQAASRSWLWGPVPFAVANEPYAESPTGLRLVEYLDKGRMEINDPTADRTSPWFVTSGLLVNEMVTGQYQTGNNSFQSRPPADLPVAGDAFSPDAPTFASFATHTERTPRLFSPGFASPPMAPSMQIDRIGNLKPVDSKILTPLTNLAQVDFSAYDDVTGHNIPRVFADWMAQSGPILENGHLTTSTLIDPLYLLGHPITEPYWADIRIDGNPATVLIQLYERRALTYNPNNPPEWQVEMANVGRAYYDWLYPESLPTPAIATNTTTNGILFHGYNWPPYSQATLSIRIPGNPTPLVGPTDSTADASGYFAANLPPTQPLFDAIQLGILLQAHADNNITSIALPFASTELSDRVRLSGTLVGIQTASATGSYTLTLQDFNNTAHTIRINPTTLINYSEDVPTLPSKMDIGSKLYIIGVPSINGLQAISVRIMSVSASSASIIYQWSPDGTHLYVSGTNWPHTTDIWFTLDPTYTSDAGPPSPFATLKTDSRGNLQGTILVPSISQPIWLRAASPDQSVKVFKPLLSPAPTNYPDPPQLSITGQQGAQLATLAYYCWANSCAPPPPDYLDYPSFALPAQPGGTLTFRSQYGPDPNLGLTPISFSTTILTSTGKTAYSSSTPLGKPFNFTIPLTLPPSTYNMQVQVTWPDPKGTNGTSDVTYGFTLQILESPRKTNP